VQGGTAPTNSHRLADSGYDLDMSGFWGVFWLAVVLKIPIVALLLIVWWAIRQEPVAEADDDDRGGSDRDPRHPRNRPPHPPRRGPHREATPRSPQRVRMARLPVRVPSGHR
jgi:hypothetical protein